jgi:pimeloyl-ACP methyl ester carboxylesterase
MKATQPQLILFSGLGANAEVLRHQKQAFPQLIVPPWQRPEKNDDLSTYSARLVESISIQRPCIIGGASFGGIIAQHVAKLISPAAVVLIGSVRNPNEFPLRIRAFRPFARVSRWLPVSLLQSLVAPCCGSVARKMFPHMSELALQFRHSDANVFRWSVENLLAWRQPISLCCPVLQVHGSRDFVLPASRVKADRYLAGAGHVLSLTHPVEVNQFIRECLDQFGLEDTTSN